jgi:hypothetical protein
MGGRNLLCNEAIYRLCLMSLEFSNPNVTLAVREARIENNKFVHHFGWQMSE